MVSTNSATISVVAVAALLQLCPAPVAVIAPIAGAIAGGALSGGISVGIQQGGKNKERDVLLEFFERDLPAGVSQESLDQCSQQINDQFSSSGTAVNVHSTSETSVQVDNVPAACMNLATVLLSDPAQAGGPVPTPLSSSSLEYTGMNSDQLQELQNALSG